MAFSVKFYTTNKRINSTKIPDGDVVTYQVNLKENCDITRPKIKLLFDNLSTNILSKNYCYIQEFSRYYFIKEWTWEERTWVATLEIDVLATYKSQIANSTLYVLRSASDYDANVLDCFYPAKIGCQFLANSSTITNWSTSPALNGGTFVLGVVNSERSELGGVSYYLMSATQISELRAYMLGSIKDWDSISDFSGDIAKAFIDPFQYIVSCMWFPVPIVGGEEVNIKFGFWESTVKGSPMVSSAGNYDGDISIPKPSRTLRGNWELVFPFAEYYVVCYPWGIIPIDGNSLISSNSLHYEIEIDYITGISVLKISANVSSTTITDQTLLESISAQVGVQIQLAQITTDYSSMMSIGGAVQTAIGTVASAITSGILGQDSGQIASATQASLSKVAISGTTGGKAALVYGGKCTLIGKFFEPVEEDKTMKGRPLCKLKKIGDLSGYIECQEGDVKLESATIDEIRAVKSHLERGFYYE